MKNKLKLIIAIAGVCVAGVSAYFTLGRCEQAVFVDGTPVESQTKIVYFGSHVDFDEEFNKSLMSLVLYDDNGNIDEYRYGFNFYVNGSKVDNIQNYTITSDVEINLVPIIDYVYWTGEHDYYDGEITDPSELENITLPDKDGRRFVGWSGPEPAYSGELYKYINKEYVASYCFDPIYESEVTFILDGKVVDSFLTPGGKVTPPNLGDNYVMFGWIKEDENEGEMYTIPEHSDGYVYFGMNRTYNYFDFENREVYEDTTFIANAVECTKIQLETEGQTRQGYWRDITDRVTVKVGEKLDFTSNTYLHIMPADLKVEISCYGHYSNCKFYVDDESLVEYDEEGNMVMKQVGSTILTIDFGGVTTKVRLNIVERYDWEDEPAYGWVD